MRPRIPRGMLSASKVVNWLARRKYPGRGVERAEDEEAWREICHCVLKGRIPAYGLTDHGDTPELERAQFAGLQERYWGATDKVRYWRVEDQRYHVITSFPPLALRTAHGHPVRGWICFFKRDLAAAFGAEGSPEKSSLAPTGVPAALPDDKPRRKRTTPPLDRASIAIKEVYPHGLPDQTTEPNVALCRKVGGKLKEKNLNQVSDDTILRAAGRRK
jgi:hypothetical protein